MITIWKKGGIEMTNRLFVGSLSYNVTNAQLEEHFGAIGRVISAKVIVDRNTGQGKGFGFVEMETVHGAKKAIEELNNTELDGRKIVVNEAKPQN